MSSGSRSSSVTSATPPPVDSVFSPTSVDVYNGVLDSRDGFIFATSVRLSLKGSFVLLMNSKADGVTHQIDISNVPTPEMRSTARRSTVSLAEATIRELYRKRLEKVPGKKIHLVNTFDGTTPSLRFRYITDYVLRKGVYRVDPAAQVGCQSCNPRMGRDIGCEYTQKCECLEYAVVDEARLNDEEKARFLQFKNGYGDTVGLPKKFPYFTEGTKKRRAGTLVPFYLNSRRPIYECNESCRCGPLCRNKNVQFGRTIELEIFKTPGDRGWGLRCKEKLYEGQFIDTYRGEIINDAEATRREEEALSKTKASYLYSLDKFAETEGLRDEDIYVVDGQFMGGPTKFMNHSCEPNCRQYTVSYNKHDPKVYDIAFFACRDIPAGEELTFDYLDKEEDEDEEVEQPGASAIPCLCGATKCRKWLWT